MSHFGLLIGYLGWPIMVIKEQITGVDISDIQVLFWAISCFVVTQAGSLMLSVRRREFQLSAILKTGIVWPIAALIIGQLLGAVVLLVVDI